MSKNELTVQWLKKANDDLVSATVLLLKCDYKGWEIENSRHRQKNQLTRLQTLQLGGIWDFLSMSFYCIQKNSKYSGYKKSRVQCTETYVWQKMIRHVHTIVSAEQNKNANEKEYCQIDTRLPGTFNFHAVRQHRQGKQDTDYWHVATGPALIRIVCSCLVRNHLPPISEFGDRIF